MTAPPQTAAVLNEIINLANQILNTAFKCALSDDPNERAKAIPLAAVAHERLYQFQIQAEHGPARRHPRARTGTGDTVMLPYEIEITDPGTLDPKDTAHRLGFTRGHGTGVLHLTEAGLCALEAAIVTRRATQRWPAMEEFVGGENLKLAEDHDGKLWRVTISHLASGTAVTRSAPSRVAARLTALQDLRAVLSEVPARRSVPAPEEAEAALQQVIAWFRATYVPQFAMDPANSPQEEREAGEGYQSRTTALRVLEHELAAARSASQVSSAP